MLNRSSQVTAPSPENVRSVFKFAIEGLKALDYVEHSDFTVSSCRSDAGNRTPIRIDATSSVPSENVARQAARFVSPESASKVIDLMSVDLVIIDEAAAIPLPVVRLLLGAHLTLLSSTISGYEGTGRALQLKLLQQLRQGHTSLHSKGRRVTSSDLTKNSKSKPGMSSVEFVFQCTTAFKSS